MKEERRKQLLDEFEEASLSLLMDEYAEIDGERLWLEFEEADKAGDIPDFPEDLDQKCKQIIQHSHAKHVWNMRLKHILRVSSKAAIITLVIIGIATSLVLSVDAFRIPVLNFILKHSERYSSIMQREENEEIMSQIEAIRKNFEYYLPEGYSLEGEKSAEYGSADLIYRNDSGNSITLKITRVPSTFIADTEDADAEKISADPSQRKRADLVRGRRKREAQSDAQSDLK